MGDKKTNNYIFNKWIDGITDMTDNLEDAKTDENFMANYYMLLRAIEMGFHLDILTTEQYFDYVEEVKVFLKDKKTLIETLENTNNSLIKRKGRGL